MKKILSLLMAVFILTALCSCVKPGPDTETTTTQTTYQKAYEVEDTVLKSCIGQADADGVYTVPDGITMISEFAFSGDKTLKKVIIPESVKTIACGAFSGCTSLVTVEMADGVTSLGAYAFYYCTSLENVRISKSLKRICPEAFSSCTALENVVIPEGVTELMHGAFKECSSLYTVSLPSTLETISSYVFSYCTALPEISFDKCVKLTSIGSNAFEYCSKLSSVEFPAELLELSSQAFYYCSSLYEISFEKCTKLSDVGYDAISYTPWYAENTSEDYMIVGDGVLIKCNALPKTLDLSGKGIKKIGGSVFFNNASYGYKYAELLNTLVIPEGVTDIGDYAFYQCYGLKKLVLPSTLINIGNYAFAGTSSVNDVTGVMVYYPQLDVDLSPCKSLEFIGSNAFFGCSETDEIILSDSVKNVGSDAFTMTKAYVNFFENAQKKTDDCSFFISGGVLLWTYVPAGITKISIPGGTRVLGGGACGGWDTGDVSNLSLDADISVYWKSKARITLAVNEVIIPDSVRMIGQYAFVNNALIKSITLPEGVTAIGDGAFTMCSALTSVGLPETLSSIGGSAFSSCDNLRSVLIPDSVKTIGSLAFVNCLALSELVFPPFLENVGNIVAGAYDASGLLGIDATSLSMTHVRIGEEFRPLIFDILGNVPQDISISYFIVNE